MPLSDLARFNRVYLRHVATISKNSPEHAAQAFGLSSGQIAAFSEVDHSKLIEFAKQSDKAVAIPVVSAGELLAHLSAKTQKTPATLDIANLNQEYLAMARLLGMNNMFSAIFRLEASVDLVNTIAKMSIDDMQNVSRFSGKCFVACALTAQTIRRIGDTHQKLMPFYSVLSMASH